MKVINWIMNVFHKNFVLFFILIFFIGENLALKTSEHFTHLAEAFLKGKLYFLSIPSNTWEDTALFNSRHFWPLGPLPAVVLMPFVFVAQRLGFLFSQAYLNIIFVLLTTYLVFRLAIHYQFTKAESWWWVLAFGISSPFLAIALIPYSSYFSQSLTTLLLFVFLWEFVNKKRFLILGLLSGALLATRLTAGISVLSFSLIFLLLGKIPWTKKLSELSRYSAPVFVTVVLLMLYNFFRFHNVWETGYNLQLLGNDLFQTRNYGIFGLIHFPGNLYYAFLATPWPVFKDNLSHVLKFPYIIPDRWGMSLFITSPYLIYLFTFKYKDSLSTILLVSSLISALVIFSYYGIGVLQYGYRYALDFLPLIFVLLLKNYKEKYGRLSETFKILIGISAMVNLYLIFVFFSLYLPW